MLVDALFDRLVSRFRRSRHQQFDELPQTPNQRKTGSRVNRRGPGLFNNAHNFVAIQVNPALERIAMYANLNATMDASARYPPPLCHPGTRLKIGDKLYSWLMNPIREWNMMWLYGPAGTGKSAVTQTFAERCDESGRLGASFFFSRLNDRNDPNTVIPTLVYQLAVCNPEYRSVVAAQLANDPELLRIKTRRTQFKKLIIDPFSFLWTQGRLSVQEPLLVVLDGLDECEGEGAQRDIIEIISEVVRLKKEFPLVWLISSRPEPHLKYVFSRADFTISYGREELAIDAESIADADFYLRDGLAGIKAEYQDATAPTWPSEDQITRLSKQASGHFGFASTSLRYIGDPAYATPMSRLDSLLLFFSGIGVPASNPLGALDTLYTGILCDVPGEVLPTIKMILGYRLYGFGLWDTVDSTQRVCNFLYIDQATFYNAFRKLHSVVDVPSPGAASRTLFQLYHLSFSDYLQDPRRSGKFAIERESASLQCSKLCVSWYKTDLELFHTGDGPDFNRLHKHGVLPDLMWISDHTGQEASCSLARHVTAWCWLTCGRVAEWDEAFLSKVRNFDFRYIQTCTLFNDWRKFINKLWKNSSDDFVRTEPRSEVDLRLLEYMEFIIKSWWRTRPATFPLKLKQDGCGGEYFLLGHGAKAVVCWTTGLQVPKALFGMLNCDQAPSETHIYDYNVQLMKDGAVKASGAVATEGV